MKVLIIEDEKPALFNLLDCLKRTGNNIDIVGTTSGITDSIGWLKRNADPDLIFMDIELCDGVSFNIFDEHPILCPVVFTTAYNKYLTEAFEHNGIDYLLKPIDFINLTNTLQKYKNLQQHFVSKYNQLTTYLNKPAKTKSRITVKKGTEFHTVKMEDIMYLFTDHKLVFAVDKDNRKYLCEISTLGEAEEIFDQKVFFRVNRKYIINANYLSKFKCVDKGKVQIELQLPPAEEIIVSQEHAPVFKKWISEL